MKLLASILVFFGFITNANALECKCDYIYQDMQTMSQTNVSVWTYCPGNEWMEVDCYANAYPGSLTAICRHRQTGQQQQQTAYLASFNFTALTGSCRAW